MLPKGTRISHARVDENIEKINGLKTFDLCIRFDYEYRSHVTFSSTPFFNYNLINVARDGDSRCRAKFAGGTMPFNSLI